MSVQIINSKVESVIMKNGDEFSVIPVGSGNDELDKAIENAGYSYDQKQDIFYSNMNPWQRDIGYCRLYDEASAPFGMIIDCEPIHFDYLEKNWMIGFWKGQYDLLCGAEIGLYTRTDDINILGLFRGAYYDCVSNADLLNMSYTLKKNGKTLFTREGKHWWLTGFKLGEFSNPSELTMDISITLHNVSMRDAFVTGLWNAGYQLDEFTRHDNTVSFTFASPHTPSPFTRIPATDLIIQRNNELLCEKYQEITESSNSFRDKVKAIEEQAPKMYNKIIRTGKSKPLFETLSSWLTNGVKQ
ncbi:MAG TPA: DUF4474 domain-containing protein [Desulfosporosinus sp.]|nr:DUF4474 domain-containing protein [Desulfosporosinus sp.]